MDPGARGTNEKGVPLTTLASLRGAKASDLLLALQSLQKRGKVAVVGEPQPHTAQDGGVRILLQALKDELNASAAGKRQGGCDDTCASDIAFSESGPDSVRTCRHLVQKYASEFDVHMTHVLDFVNRACQGQCACNADAVAAPKSAMFEELPDYGDECGSKQVADERAPDAWQSLVSGEPMAGSLINFERASPWYCYSTKQAGPLGGRSEEVVRVKLFDHQNIHIGGRVARATVPAGAIPHNFKWGRAALHIRLDHPRWPGKREDGAPHSEDFDHWDRVGSFGFLLPGDGPSLRLFPFSERAHMEWPLTPSSPSSP